MVLSAHQLKQEAQAATGLTDFGEAPLDCGLEKLCKSLNKEAKLTELGLRQAAGHIRGNLIQRLQVQHCYTRHPEIDAQLITQPIVVFGLPRSGTTALSQFLAQDRSLRSIRRWEEAQLTPPPESGTQQTDPRIEATRRAFAERDRAMPSLMAMLPVTAEDPSEHGGLLGFTFRSLSLSGVYRVPSYERWVESCEMRGAYDYLARLLKLLQWRCPPDRWNLKYPMDLYFLETLRSVFPDAILVWCHRDPACSIPSVASLLCAFRARVSESVDPTEVGRTEFEQKLEGVRRGMAFIDGHGDGAVLHVHSAELAQDPVATVRRLYGQIGRDFSTEFEQALAARQRARPKGKFGQHRYRAADFALNEVEIRSAFADYMDRFEIASEV
tara:strand:- start:1294 stop:2445 length:1152 start_codon:yes stop_codon:yes gene_type:complete